MASRGISAEAEQQGSATARNGRPVVGDTTLVFVVPVYNEAENLPRLLADFEARPALFQNGGRLVLVDDGSTDGTTGLVGAYCGPVPVEFVRLERNQGPGAAFWAGFEAVLADCADDALVVTLEGDTTSDLDALPLMFRRAEAGAELVVADWRMVNVGAMRRLLSHSAGFVVRRALGLKADRVLVLPGLSRIDTSAWHSTGTATTSCARPVSRARPRSSSNSRLSAFASRRFRFRWTGAAASARARCPSFERCWPTGGCCSACAGPAPCRRRERPELAIVGGGILG